MSSKPVWLHPGHFPRVYDVDGEGLYFRFRQGEQEFWVPVSWPEARTFSEDLQAALMRRFRAVEAGKAPPSAVPTPVPTRRNA